MDRRTFFSALVGGGSATATPTDDKTRITIELSPEELRQALLRALSPPEPLFPWRPGGYPEAQAQADAKAMKPVFGSPF